MRKFLSQISEDEDFVVSIFEAGDGVLVAYKRWIMNKVELLAPAGNFSKFLTAIQFGADAVYIGGKTFSLRALSENSWPRFRSSDQTYRWAIPENIPDP